MQIVDHCHTAADVWAAADRVRAWRVSLKPPIRRIPIMCRDRSVVIPIMRPKPRRQPGLHPAKFVIETVAAHYGVSVLDILARRRNPKVILPRHVAMYVLKNVSLMSLPEMGRHFDRDHSTIHHAIEKVGELVRSDPSLKQAVETLIQECAL